LPAVSQAGFAARLRQGTELISASGQTPGIRTGALRGETAALRDVLGSGQARLSVLLGRVTPAYLR
jgi:hypothetical protein